MPTYRLKRANSFIQEELTLLLGSSVRDPRVCPLVITDVDLTADRRVARVYVSCFSGGEDLQEALRGLESAKSYLRRELGQRLGWRFTPQLEFRIDQSLQHGAKIDGIFQALEQERKDRLETDAQPDED